MSYLMVVRRGTADKFEFLQQAFQDRPVEVILDRRQEDRRKKLGTRTPDRRREHRRGKPPSTWTLADFVLVNLSH